MLAVYMMWTAVFSLQGGAGSGAFLSDPEKVLEVSRWGAVNLISPDSRHSLRRAKEESKIQQLHNDWHIVGTKKIFRRK